MQERILGFVAIALALVIAGVALFWQPDDARAALAPSLLSSMVAISRMQSAGGPVSLRDYRGKLVLVYFGYTYLPGYLPDARWRPRPRA